MQAKAMGKCAKRGIDEDDIIKLADECCDKAEEEAKVVQSAEKAKIQCQNCK